MDETAFACATRLLPDGLLEFAAYGSVIGSGDASAFRSSPIPLTSRAEVFGAGDRAAPSIIAVGTEQVFLIDLQGDQSTVEGLAVFDVRAELDTSGEAPVVCLAPSELLGQDLHVYFRIDFALSGSPPLSPRALAEHLEEAINRAGIPARSGHALVRFLARSIRAHQTNEPAYLSEVLPSSYRASVRKTSVGGAIRELSEESGWLSSFVAAFETGGLDEDEIFLLFEAKRWILTNRRLYLVDRRHGSERVSLDAIRSYRFHGLLRRSLEIRLADGTVLRRPGPENCYLSEHEFEQLIEILATRGLNGGLARGHA